MEIAPRVGRRPDRGVVGGGRPAAPTAWNLVRTSSEAGPVLTMPGHDEGQPWSGSARGSGAVPSFPSTATGSPVSLLGWFRPRTPARPIVRRFRSATTPSVRSITARRSAAKLSAAHPACPLGLDLGVGFPDRGQQAPAPLGEPDYARPLVGGLPFQAQVTPLLQVADDPIDRLLGRECPAGQIGGAGAFWCRVLEHGEIGRAEIVIASLPQPLVDLPDARAARQGGEAAPVALNRRPCP